MCSRHCEPSADGVAIHNPRHCEPSADGVAIHIRKIMEKQGYVYILFNKRKGTLYTGVTSNIIKRVYEHKNKLITGFSSFYGIDKLGYYEVHSSITSAIEREKQIKSGSRKKKLDLIETANPEWLDLYDSIL